ncbi:MAG TPA: hypothetical protein VJH65_00335 [Candidatus Nanoarchaeia archaeon]|nr:hypothetical protein [Candidatus Nanoarchaeia archaeon]
MKKRENNCILDLSLFNKNKKAQLAIFVVIAVVIAVAGVLIFLFYPQILPGAAPPARVENPAGILQSCLEENLTEIVEKISSQGGDLDPKHYILYKGEKLKYLCYTSQYYVPCVVQEPLIFNHVTSEIKNGISGKVTECFDEMQNFYEEEGYTYDLDADLRNIEGAMNLELLPKKVVLTLNTLLTVSKGEEPQRFEKFVILLDNNLYELLSIATSIISFEVSIGDAETTDYMNIYHDLKVEKIVQGEGSTIYILTDRNTGNKFQFASRSIALPPGYGLA